MNITPLFIRQSSFLSIVHYSLVIWTACGTPSHLLRPYFHMPNSTKRGIHLIWRVRGEGINSSLFAPFISLSKGNAFIDVIIGGMDEMIKMEINCCFEKRQHSTGTQQDWCGKQEVCLSTSGGWQGRDFFF